MDMPDLNLLVALDALLQEGSVTRAARRVGLSTPAMSHALNRLRRQLGDPVLVRAGRTMVLTPRADALRERVRSFVQEARQALDPLRPFEATTLSRTFVISASDYVLLMIGQQVDQLVTDTAPLVNLRFLPNAPEDLALLREGSSDLAVGIYGVMPPEVRSRTLLTDRLVCVVRDQHPHVGRRLTLEQFIRVPHIQVAPRGRPGGYLDDTLAERGVQRRVARAVPYFTGALQLAAQTDYLLVAPERMAQRLAPRLGLRTLEVPLDLSPYALSLVWHPRFDGDAAHRFLRETFTRAAASLQGPAHASPRTRLEATADPTLRRTPARRGRARLNPRA